MRSLVVIKLVPRETSAVSVHVMCTPHGLQCHFMQSHIHRVHACSAICHQRFWQNDRDLLRATAVTRGWNGYRNQGQHRKLTLKKKNSPAAPAGTQTLGLSIDHESGVLPLSYPRSECHTNGHCLCDSVPHSSWDSNCVVRYCCAMASGHCLNILFFWRRSTESRLGLPGWRLSRVFTLSPSSLVPVPNGPPRLCGR